MTKSCFLHVYETWATLFPFCRFAGTLFSTITASIVTSLSCRPSQRSFLGMAFIAPQADQGLECSLPQQNRDL